jgi:hypothetical protein
MGFRCAACSHDLAIEASRAPDAILRCSDCEKIFGRTDAVVTEMVDKATELSTQMLRLALGKMRRGSEVPSRGPGQCRPAGPAAASVVRQREDLDRLHERRQRANPLSGGPVHRPLSGFEIDD